MLNKKVQKAINDQITAELYSANLYLSMSAWFDSMNLKGFANWMRVQYQEETFHALKFYDYVLSRQGSVTLAGIDAPATVWKSPLNAFEETLKHEQHVTSLINNLAFLAQEEKDLATGILLQWYVTEQIEEEANAEGILQKLKLAGDDPGALFMIDNELAARVYTPPAAVGA
ncbi:MAG: ferritin [Candidatus Hydrogenedentes bacterium]|nr:ferritin [Candidatus Hydrogenedentota bacterium]